jgi:hypothetical protein
LTQREKRGNQRVHAALPVFLENATGITRDVGASGTFFWTSRTYAPGESINLTIGLKTASGRMMQRCQGAVVRTERLAHMVGVAVRIVESTIESA